MEQGQVIQERYELTSPIGSGGMAEVWCAHDKRLNREVAVKFLAPRLSQDPEFLVRFFAEAQSVARISHPNVVGVLDFGEFEDAPYLVMEFAPGGSLADLKNEPLTVERALELVAEAASGVGAAHEIGLVHRDIKPANILLTELGKAKIADFGIAAGKSAESFTATGTAIGSPHYISPEQVSGSIATPASDVYSLGVVLYELIAGHRPFEGDNITAVAIAQVEKTPQPPSDFVEDLDPAVDALVMRCLSKDPAERFADGSAVAAAIQGLSGAATRGMSGTFAAAPAIAAVTDTGTGVLATGGAGPADADGSGAKVGRPVLASLIVIALLAMATFGVLASTKESAPADASVEETQPSERTKPSKRPSASPSTSTSGTVTQPSGEPSPSAEPEKEKTEEETSEEETEEEPEPEPTEAEPSPTPEPSSSPASSPAAEEATAPDGEGEQS